MCTGMFEKQNTMRKNDGVTVRCLLITNIIFFFKADIATIFTLSYKKGTGNAIEFWIRNNWL